jgi:TolB protein
VFASTRDGGEDWEIYAMDADGSNPRRLTSSPGRDAHPQWSRDGKRILFQSPRDWEREGQVSVYEMDAPMTQPATNGAAGSARRLVASGAFDGVPVPSPDGRRMAFMRGTLAGEKYHWDIWLADADGKNARPLTKNAWSSQVPTWSPDSRTIVFHSDPMGQNRLFTMDVETTNATPLLVSAGDFVDEVPSYSPDGARVAFVSTRDGGRDLYILEVAGGKVARLTRGMDVWSQASWSPDGGRILFSAKRSELDDVYVINADGTGLARLTKGFEGVR